MDDATEDLARIIADGLMAQSDATDGWSLQVWWINDRLDLSRLQAEGELDCRELARFIIRAMVEKAATA